MSVSLKKMCSFAYELTCSQYFGVRVQWAGTIPVTTTLRSSPYPFYASSEPQGQKATHLLGGGEPHMS